MEIGQNNLLDKILNEAIAKITAQQPKGCTAVWMVGEQLKDMVRAEPHLAELVAQDLSVEAMSLADCEKRIKAFADKHKTGGFACVVPAEAERIIREFYGLPARDGERIAAPVGGLARDDEATDIGEDIDLSAFF